MIQENSSLLPYNTFGIDVKAKRLGVFNDIESLRDLLSQKNEDELLIIGGGSNLLLTKDFDGLVLKNEIKGIHVISENDKEVLISAGAGENWHAFVMHCINNNWAGIENLSLIPGSVGASPMQNIGAYGHEVSEFITRVRTYDRELKEIYTFTNSQCEFTYRNSYFKAHPGRYVVLDVQFQLRIGEFSAPITYLELSKKLGIEPGDKAPVVATRAAVLELRASKGMLLSPDDHDSWSAGSFFTNPIISQQAADA